jgi:hypothetical protein
MLLELASKEMVQEEESATSEAAARYRWIDGCWRWQQ